MFQLRSLRVLCYYKFIKELPETMLSESSGSGS
jgi:hypothetical protein